MSQEIDRFSIYTKVGQLVGKMSILSNEVFPSSSKKNIKKFQITNKNTRNHKISGVFIGAADQIRTGDLILTKPQI